MSFGTVTGTDNIVTNRKIEFKYKVAKPYTCLLSEEVTPPPIEYPGPDGELYVIQPPKLSSILERVEEDLWSSKTNFVFEEADSFASNGALENALRYGEVLGYVTLLEGGSTLNMIKNIFFRLFKAIMEIYKKAKKLNLPATLEVLSDLWLEYRYGWRPLFADLSNLQDLITHTRKNGIKSSYGTSKVRKPSNEPIHIGDVTVLGPLAQTFEYAVFFKTSHAHSKVGYNFLNADSSRNDDWLALLGLDLESLPSTVWDLIPFSFVVDMFLNVSDVLKVQNSSEHVSSFNHYVTHQLNGEVLLECKSCSLEVPGEPIDWDLVFQEFPSIYLNRYYGSLPVDLSSPASFVKSLLRKGYMTNDGDHYWPNKNIFNGFPIHVTLDYRVTNGVPNIPYSDPPFPPEFLFSKGTHSHLQLRPAPWQSSNSKIINNVLFRVLNFSKLTDEECRLFIKRILHPVSPRQRRRLTSFFRSPPGHLNAGIYGFFVDSQRVFMDAFKKYPDSLTFTAPPTTWITTSSNYTLGYKPERLITLDIDLSVLNFGAPVTVTTRRCIDGINHLFTTDLELSSGQVADLSALSISLTKRFRK
jgi:hypothetical protein